MELPSAIPTPPNPDVDADWMLSLYTGGTTGGVDVRLFPPENSLTAHCGGKQNVTQVITVRLRLDGCQFNMTQ